MKILNIYLLVFQFIAFIHGKYYMVLYWKCEVEKIFWSKANLFK